MVIKREDIDNRKVDFSVAGGRRHPGDILRDEFLTPMGVNVYALANAIKVPRSRLNDIVLRRHAIPADTALRLARYFGMSPFWINLQAHYDLDVADRTMRRRVERTVVSEGDFPIDEETEPIGMRHFGGLGIVAISATLRPSETRHLLKHRHRRAVVAAEVSSRDTSLKRPTIVSLVVKPIGKPNARKSARSV